MRYRAGALPRGRDVGCWRASPRRPICGGDAGMGVSAEDVAAWLATSCAAQGVPVLVTDPGVLADVAALLCGVPGSAGRAVQPSTPPDRSDPAGVKGSAAGLSGVDECVVENC